MPECDGFDALELLGADLPETVIFVTAYADYALRAFEAGALDYILKPLDHVRFSRASSARKVGSRAAPRINPLGQRCSQESRPDAVFKGLGNRLDRSREILCVPASGPAPDTHRAQDHPGNSKRDLDTRTFFRIHRSIIVNLERVRGLELQANGEYEVLLDSNIRLKLSRRFRKRLQDRLGGL